MANNLFSYTLEATSEGSKVFKLADAQNALEVAMRLFGTDTNIGGSITSCVLGYRNYVQTLKLNEDVDLLTFIRFHINAALEEIKPSNRTIWEKILNELETLSDEKPRSDLFLSTLGSTKDTRPQKLARARSILKLSVGHANEKEGDGIPGIVAAFRDYVKELVSGGSEDGLTKDPREFVRASVEAALNEKQPGNRDEWESALQEAIQDWT